MGQYLGDLAFGGYLSGFVGAIVPAFWLLVPGALGLIGVTEYLG